MGCFLACSLGTAQTHGRGLLLLCKASLSQNKDGREDLQGPPSGKQKERTLTWEEDLLSLPPVLSLSLLDVPEMDAGCAIVPETLCSLLCCCCCCSTMICDSFCFLLLLLFFV